jgi:prepilin-type N-terminal cleavage/methylation domain-containing protein
VRWYDEKGLTLIELLVTVAAIAVISAIAVPSFVSMLDESQQAVAHRNAQNIAMVCSVAVAAGNETIPAAANLDEALDLLFEGVTGNDNFVNRRFELTDMSAEDREAAKPYLRFAGGVIIYSP